MMEMISLLVLFLLAAGPAVTLSSPEEQLQGKFDTSDGSRCLWFELRKSGGGGGSERRNVFVTACHCKNEDGGRQSYSCEFDGAMEQCEEYKRSPKEYYGYVAAALQSEGPSTMI